MDNFKHTTESLQADVIRISSLLRSRMYEIDVNTLRAAMDKLHRNTAQIRNVTAYVMSTIFNCITEEYSSAHVDPFLNEMRRRE